MRYTQVILETVRDTLWAASAVTSAGKAVPGKASSEELSGLFSFRPAEKEHLMSFEPLQSVW